MSARRVSVAYDVGRLLADRPIRMAMQDGLHVRVVQRISAQEARELIAELEAALALALENYETRAKNCPDNAADASST